MGPITHSTNAENEPRNATACGLCVSPDSGEAGERTGRTGCAEFRDEDGDGDGEERDDDALEDTEGGFHGDARALLRRGELRGEFLGRAYWAVDAEEDMDRGVQRLGGQRELGPNAR
jgi:hypothetical protein